MPIAQNFVQGQQKNGVYFGATSIYKWQFSKAIEQSWWDSLLSGGWEAAKAYLTAKNYFQYVNIGGVVDGFVSKVDHATSDNNHVGQPVQHQVRRLRRSKAGARHAAPWRALRGAPIIARLTGDTHE